ncbi:MAG: sulfatase [bacterium]
MNRREFIGSASAGAAAFCLGSGSLSASQSKPNIIIIMADDLGYGDLGCYGADMIRTPVIDRMASEGVRLTQFFSCASICSPSRSGLMTGRYPIRNGVNNNFGPTVNPASFLVGALTDTGLGMNTREITLGQAMKAEGYATCCIGKWHLGDLDKYMPTSRGFDHYFGIPYSNDMDPVKLYDDLDMIEYPVNQDTLTKRYTREALQFIQANKDRPFLLYLPHTFPHVPLHASKEFEGRSDAGRYGDCVEEIDWSTGRILDALEKYGIAENTLVVFTSDNGPWYQGNTSGLRERKHTPFEGGVRVPLIARWPGTLPQGVVSDEIAINLDLFTTAVEAAGGNPPADRPVDGRNLMPLLKGGDSAHDALYFYRLQNLWCIRTDEWKYHRSHRMWCAGSFHRKRGPMLFNVKEDPEESYNLIEKYPDKAAELESMMTEWEENLVKGVPR